MSGSDCDWSKPCGCYEVRANVQSGQYYGSTLSLNYEPYGYVQVSEPCGSNKDSMASMSEYWDVVIEWIEN